MANKQFVYAGAATADGNEKGPSGVASYIIVTDSDGEKHYLANSKYINQKVETLDGYTYNEKSNTLTINNVNCSSIEANEMGVDFKINVKGKNNIDNYVLVWGFGYGGGVTFTGDGSITINKNQESKCAIKLNTEGAHGQCIFEDTVSADLYAGKSESGSYAIYVSDSRDQKGIVIPQGKYTPKSDGYEGVEYEYEYYVTFNQAKTWMYLLQKDGEVSDKYYAYYSENGYKEDKSLARWNIYTEEYSEKYGEYIAIPVENMQNVLLSDIGYELVYNEGSECENVTNHRLVRAFYNPTNKTTYTVYTDNSTKEKVLIRESQSFSFDGENWIGVKFYSIPTIEETEYGTFVMSEEEYEEKDFDISKYTMVANSLGYSLYSSWLEESHVEIKGHTHSYTSTITKANATKGTAGKIVKKCSCGDTKTTIIAAPKTVVLSATSYVYNGKTRKPAVTVKDSAGKVIAVSNYTVTYPANMINAGTKTIKITFKGTNYTGVLTKAYTVKKASNSITGVAASYNKTAAAKAQSFTIKAKANGTVKYASNNKNVTITNAGKITIAKNFSGKAVITITAGNANYNTVTKKITVNVKPANVTLKSVKNTASKKMTVAWNKLAYATGYQIQYSTNSKFASGNKTVTVKGAANVSKAIAGLTKGKTYYVRIRAYKTAGTNIFGAFSAAKSVKITK